MAEPGVEPTLRGYLHVLRRGRWWIAAFSLLGLAVSLTLSLTSTKQYSATAQLLVQSAANVSLSTDSSQSLITMADVQTELQLVTSAQVQQAVVKKLGSAPGVSASQVGQTDVIAVTAVSTQPADAALIANTYARAFVAWSTATASANLSAAENQLNAQIKAITKEIGQLPGKDVAQAAALSNQQAVLKGQLAQLQVAGATASTGLEMVTPATAPRSPSSPKPAEDGLLGLIAGLAIGTAAAFLRDTLDDTLSSGDAVERVIDAPVLATVPMVSSWRKKIKPVVISVSEPTSQPAEAYRSLRTSLQFVRQDRPLRTILVTSPSAGDGKTATVVNLGAVFAQAGSRVVLVSCDLRRPGLSQFFAPSGHAELFGTGRRRAPRRGGDAGPGCPGTVDARHPRDLGEPDRAAVQPADAQRADGAGAGVRHRADRQPAGAAGGRRHDPLRLCRRGAARGGNRPDQARRTAADQGEAQPGGSGRGGGGAEQGLRAGRVRILRGLPALRAAQGRRAERRGQELAGPSSSQVKNQPGRQR